MKFTVAIIVAFLIAGCTSSTDFGPCVGAFDDKDPALHYNVSSWNLFVGVFFFGLIAPPIFVIVDETFCPVGVK